MSWYKDSITFDCWKWMLSFRVSNTHSTRIECTVKHHCIESTMCIMLTCHRMINWDRWGLLRYQYSPHILVESLELQCWTCHLHISTWILEQWVHQELHHSHALLWSRCLCWECVVMVNQVEWIVLLDEDIIANGVDCHYKGNYDEDLVGGNGHYYDHSCDHHCW